MSSATVVRMQNGGTIAVRTGVLRGAGPQGPMGPAGPKGAKGDLGPVGPQPDVTQQRSHLTTNAAVATGGDGLWYDLSLPLDTNNAEPNDLLVTPLNQYGFQFIQTGTFFGYLRVRFEQQSGTETGGTSQASRRVRIVDANNPATVIVEASVAAAPTEPTIVAFPLTFSNVDVSKSYKAQAYSDDPAGGVSVTFRSLRLFRINAGPRGVQGLQGPVGQTGPQGPTGPAGSAGGGYTTADALIGGGDSSAAPTTGTAVATADQGIPYPSRTQPPALPYFWNSALSWLERRIVAIYASATDRSTKRTTRNPGELTYLGDKGNFQFREKNGADLDIGRVIYSNATPPAGAGQAAPGVLWVQY